MTGAGNRNHRGVQFAGLLSLAHPLTHAPVSSCTAMSTFLGTEPPRVGTPTHIRQHSRQSFTDVATSPSDLDSPSTGAGFVELIAKADQNSTHTNEGCDTQDMGEKGFRGRRHVPRTSGDGLSTQRGGFVLENCGNQLSIS